MGVPGRGMHVYKSQTRYEGQWKAGKREGHGTFWVIQGQYYVRRYRGSWKANYYHVSTRGALIPCDFHS